MTEIEIESMDEDDFIRSLAHPEAKKEYILERNKKSREIKSNYNKEKKFFADRIVNMIEEDKRHSSIINSCISPFTTGPLFGTDYKFIRAAPLFELNLPNMDFLLFKRNSDCNIAIFGECKGSFSDPASIIKELNERKSCIEQKKEYIIDNYLHLSPNERVHFEYVIAVPDKDAARMQNCIIDKDSGFILWQTSLTGKAEISCIFPPSKLDPKEKMMHIDHTLRKQFNGGRSIECLRVMIDYFPQSYEFNKLSILILAAKFNASKDSERIVTKKDLNDFISKNIFYMDNEFIQSEVAQVISKGLEIEFLTKLEESVEECYAITTNPQKSNSLERHLKAKWIKSKLEKEFQRMKQEAILEIRIKFEKARAQKRLSDFT